MNHSVQKYQCLQFDFLKICVYSYKSYKLERVETVH